MRMRSQYYSSFPLTMAVVSLFAGLIGVPFASIQDPSVRPYDWLLLVLIFLSGGIAMVLEPHAAGPPTQDAQVHTAASDYTSGLRWMILARTNAEYGLKAAFLKAIDMAESTVTAMEPTLDATNNQFNLVGGLQERAQGHTLLGEPLRALEIYRESDRVQPFRPMRDLGVFAILQTQAHAYAGNIDTGLSLPSRGSGSPVATNRSDTFHACSACMTGYKRRKMPTIHGCAMCGMR